MMKNEVTIYWKKWRLGGLEVWQFRTGNHFFSCYLLSINKRRRPERIFVKFSVYRYRTDMRGKDFYKNGEFEVDDKEVWKKLKK
jgi:hypothetical protein